MIFDEIVKKYEFTDARLVGDSIFVSAAEYWILANRTAHLFMRSAEEPGGLKGFLTKLEGFHLFLDNEVAGTGITISAYPAIDLALLHLQTSEQYAAEKRRSVLSDVDFMRRNLNGFVVRDYDVGSDETFWVFGRTRFPRLRTPVGSQWPDDPMSGRTEDIPLGEFLDYLRDWYHPRCKKMREEV